VRGKHLEHYGATVGYGMKTDLLSFDVGFDWNGSIFDTDGLTTAFPELQKRPLDRIRRGSPRTADSACSDFPLIAEYDGGDEHGALHAKPAGMSVPCPRRGRSRLAIDEDLRRKAVRRLQITLRTAGMLGAFPQRRLLGSVGTFVTDNIRLALEYNKEYDFQRFREARPRGRNVDLQLTYEW